MFFYLTAFLVLLLDQATKLWIRANLDIGETLCEAGFLRITRIPPNTGAAFGLFRGYSPVLTAIAVATSVILLICPIVLCRRISWLNTTLPRFAFGLILGGTLGNLVDRLQPSLGGVTDFINVSFWPTFNLADSAITIGVITFILYLLRLAKTDRL